VKSLIRRRGLKLEAPSPLAGTWPWAFRVRTLGAFSLLRHDEPMPAVGKAQRRPLELLQALIAQGGERVPVERLAESLWPRIDGDSAHRSFTTTLHRLRKLLGEDRALVLHESKLTLDRRYFWVDIWAFEELIAEIDAAQRAPRAAAGRAGLDGLAQRLLDLYRGPFLAAEPEASWQMQRRERLRARFARAAAALGRAWQGAGDAPRAAEFFEQCFEIDPQSRPTEEIIHK
jgi:LuxR family maltose regulon positive regulatory protein